MSRFFRVIQGVASGYVLLAVTAVYALGSIPLALHYLTKERFGLWALLASLIGYLNMIDLGMSSSVGRHLVDVKDDRHGGAYGSMIKTGWCVLFAQAAIFAIIGVSFAGPFSHWLGIPAHLDRTFRVMIWLQCGVGALGFATKMFHHLLLAHQRLDLVNYSGVLGLGVNFAGLWIFFALGADVFSLIYAGLAVNVVTAVFQLAWCWKLSLFPRGAGWGRVSGAMFKEMFSYGRDVFLVTLGSQMIMASQTMIITRQLGLEAAAAWSVGTKTFALLFQAVSRVYYSSLAALSEMLVRNELNRLRDRHPSLVILLASLSTFCAVTFALCNSVFVSVWTSGEVSWASVNDVWLGLWLMVLAMSGANGSLILLTKKIGAMKYVYFVEGAVFISLACLVTRTFGLAGMIACSVICSLCFSGAYNAWRVSRLLGFSFQTAMLSWSRNALCLLAVFGPIAAAAWWGARSLNLPLRLGLGVLVGVLVGAPLFLRLGLPGTIKREMIARAPRRLVPLFEFAMGRVRADA